jgi:hypothetical protein
MTSSCGIEDRLAPLVSCASYSCASEAADCLGVPRETRRALANMPLTRSRVEHLTKASRNPSATCPKKGVELRHGSRYIT